MAPEIALIRLLGASTLVWSARWLWSMVTTGVWLSHQCRSTLWVMSVLLIFSVAETQVVIVPVPPSRGVGPTRWEMEMDAIENECRVSGVCDEQIDKTRYQYSRTNDEELLADELPHTTTTAGVLSRKICIWSTTTCVGGNMKVLGKSCCSLTISTLIRI